MKHYIIFLLFIIPIGVICQSSNPIMFIYDGSGSMWGEMEGKTKHEIARDVLLSTVESFDKSQGIGLVAYGHRNEKDCDDVEELIPLESINRVELINAVNTIKPTGRTPLARSASMVLSKLESSNTSATIILITDGIESCDGKICDVVKEAKEKGIEFKLHIVGFGLKGEDTSELQCAASTSGGEYFDADNSDMLKEYLKVASEKRVESPVPNASFNVLKNGKGIDAILKFYDRVADKQINSLRTYGRQAQTFLEYGNYRVEVEALENTDLTTLYIDNISIVDDSANAFEYSFDAGHLSVMLTNNGEGWDGLVHIINKHTGKNHSSGRTYGRTKSFELDPGLYNLEYKPLKISGLNTSHFVESILIEANKTLELKHNFKSVVFNIEVINGKDFINSTVHISDSATNTHVKGGRTYASESSNSKSFLLMPGQYSVKIKPLDKSIGAERTIQVDLTGLEQYAETFNFKN